MKNIINKVSDFFKGLKNKLPKNIKFPKIKCPCDMVKIKAWFKENKLLSIGFIVVFFAFIFGYFLKGFFVAALVNGRPITRLRVIKELEKKQGLSALDSIVTEELIRQEAGKKGIKVTSADVETEIKKIEESLKTQGQDINTLLSAQGMTRTDLVKNIEMQKMIEQLLADKATVTDEEVQKYIDDNKSTFPEGTNLDEVKVIVKQQLVQQKVSTEFQAWLDAVKKAAKINILVKY
jgi:foldase protein PrsA